MNPIILGADQSRHFNRRGDGQNSPRIASGSLQVLECPSIVVQFLGNMVPIISSQQSGRLIGSLELIAPLRCALHKGNRRPHDLMKQDQESNRHFPVRFGSPKVAEGRLKSWQAELNSAPHKVTI